MNSKKILKIVVPVLMVLIVLVIGISQNPSKEIDSTIDESNQNEFPLTITSLNLDELKTYELPMIIDFGSDDCIPCQEMFPELEIINEEMQGKAIVHFVDIWEYPEAGEGIPLQIIPTQIFFNADGTAYVPNDELLDEIGFIIYSDSTTLEHTFTIHLGALTADQMRAILVDMGVVL